MSTQTFARSVRHALVLLAFAAAPQLFAQDFSHTDYHSPNRPTEWSTSRTRSAAGMMMSLRPSAPCVKSASSASGSLHAQVAVAVGSHTLTVNAWNSAGTLFSSKSTFSVH
jgi:hypothetical protein